MGIPFPNAPELSDAVAYIAGGSAIIIGLMMVGWGRFWSRPLVALAGVGIGLLCGDLLAEVMKVDVAIARAAVAAILGVLGFVAAPFFWAFFAGALCSSVAGTAMALNFLAGLPEGTLEATPPEGGYTLAVWGEWLGVFSSDISSAMWERQASIMVLVIAPAGLIPVLIGLWRQRLATILMTSFVGAIAVAGGAVIAITQSDSTRWPAGWSGAAIPLCVIGGLWICGVAVQYAFVMSAARKKKAKEVAQAQADNDARSRKK